MTKKEHYSNLESMYAAAPVNSIYEPVMEVSEGQATIEIELSEKYHHSAGGVHGSVYFKMLDDAAFFAANSLEEQFLRVNNFVYYLHHTTCFIWKDESYW